MSFEKINQDELEYKKIDLYSDEYDQKFADAKEFVDLAPLVVEEVTEEGLAENLYEDKGVVKDANGHYSLVAYEMQTRKTKDGDEIRALVAEDTYKIEAGMWILTRPVNREGEPQTHFVADEMSDVMEHYEEADRFDNLEGFSFGPELPRGVVVRPKGYMEKAIQPIQVLKNDTGMNVAINDNHGTGQKGMDDCYFVKSGNARYLVSKDDFQSYIPYKKYQDQ